MGAIRRNHAAAKQLGHVRPEIVIEIDPQKRFLRCGIRPRGRQASAFEIDPEMHRIIESGRVNAIVVEVENQRAGLADFDRAFAKTPRLTGKRRLLERQETRRIRAQGKRGSVAGAGIRGSFELIRILAVTLNGMLEHLRTMDTVRSTQYRVVRNRIQIVEISGLSPRSGRTLN